MAAPTWFYGCSMSCLVTPAAPDIWVLCPWPCPTVPPFWFSNSKNIAVNLHVCIWYIPVGVPQEENSYKWKHWVKKSMYFKFTTFQKYCANLDSHCQYLKYLFLHYLYHWVFSDFKVFIRWVRRVSLMYLPYF